MPKTVCYPVLLHSDPNHPTLPSGARQGPYMTLPCYRSKITTNKEISENFYRFVLFAARRGRAEFGAGSLRSPFLRAAPHRAHLCFVCIRPFVACRQAGWQQRQPHEQRNLYPGSRKVEYCPAFSIAGNMFVL